jgi:hypothetical protein
MIGLTQQTGKPHSDAERFNALLGQISGRLD